MKPHERCALLSYLPYFFFQQLLSLAGNVTVIMALNPWTLLPVFPLAFLMSKLRNKFCGLQKRVDKYHSEGKYFPLLAITFTGNYKSLLPFTFPKQSYFNVFKLYYSHQPYIDASQLYT